MKLIVQSTEEIEKIIEHFYQFPLKIKKFADYELLKKVHSLIKNKEHLTIDGLNKIVGLKAKHNRGISPKL